jgi:hypothetical protein
MSASQPKYKPQHPMIHRKLKCISSVLSTNLLHIPIIHRKLINLLNGLTGCKNPKHLYIGTIILIILLSTSCSPQYRLKRLIALHPELQISDTIRILDTILIPAVQADTIIHIDSLFDTLFLEKDQLHLSLVRLHDTLYLQGKCETDTIFYEKTIPVDKIIVKNNPQPSFITTLSTLIPWFVIGLALFLIFLGLLRFLYR